METNVGVSNAQPSLDINIDWQQYFKDFCDVHGRYYVVYQDEWLLFPDGYRYSAQNYSGPEIPPPSDHEKLRTLQQYYWERRRRIVRLEHRKVQGLITELKTMQHHRSAPLSRRVTYRDDDGKYVTTSTRLDTHDLERRLKWLESDIQLCTSELDKLK